MTNFVIELFEGLKIVDSIHVQLSDALIAMTPKEVASSEEVKNVIESYRGRIDDRKISRIAIHHELAVIPIKFKTVLVLGKVEESEK